MNSQKKHFDTIKGRHRFFIWAAVVLSAVLVFSGYQYFMDQAALREGSAALDKGDIEQAYQAFSKGNGQIRLVEFIVVGSHARRGLAITAAMELEKANRLFDIGDYHAAYQAYARLRTHAQTYGLIDFLSIAENKMAASLNKSEAVLNGAYAQADCQTVTSEGNWLIHNRLPSEDATGDAERQTRMKRCQVYTENILPIDPADPFIASQTLAVFLIQDPDDALSLRVGKKLDGWISTLGIRMLASPPVCDWIYLGKDIRHVPVDANSLYFCGLAYYNNRLDESAAKFLQEYVDDFPDDRYHQAAIDALIELAFKRTDPAKTGRLPAPRPSGSGEKGAAIFTVQNDAPLPVRVYFRGEKNIVQTVEACAACQPYATEPLSCPDKGPQAKFKLPPGRFDMLVETSGDGSVTPYLGNFRLGEGQAYSECFFIVASPE